MKVPLLTPPPGAVHVPPASGVPPNELNKVNGASVAHVERVPFVPAFGAWVMFTVTTAVALAHGAVPVTV